MNTTTVPDSPPKQHSISPAMTLLFAAACGLIVANIYYAQPLAGPISASLGMAKGAAGLIVTMSQLGYGLGLLLIVPLGDLIENRRLILTVMSVDILALVGAALSTHPLPFLVLALLIGIASVSPQILLPFAAHLAPEEKRGQTVGNVMSGLMLGIMLARPAASFTAHVSSWHIVFGGAAAIMILLAIVLSRLLPRRQPESPLSYRQLLGSMGHIVMTTPTLQRRALYHACLFGAFSLFWTTSPLLLAGSAYHLSQAGIALFAIAGVAGAIAAPIVGRLADKGWSRAGTGLAMVAVGAAFVISRILPAGSPAALAVMVFAAILLDFGTTANVVIGQRAIYALGAEHRSRLNGLYMAIFFCGGAVGSAAGGWAFADGGWPMASTLGFCFPVIALAYYATEKRSSMAPAADR